MCFASQKGPQNQEHRVLARHLLVDRADPLCLRARYGHLCAVPLLLASGLCHHPTAGRPVGDRLLDRVVHTGIRYEFAMFAAQHVRDNLLNQGKRIMSQNQHGAMDGLLDPDSLLLDEDEEDDSMHNHKNAGGDGRAASASSPKNPVLVCPTSHITGRFSICGDEFDECESEKQPNDFVVNIPTQPTTTQTTIHHPTSTLYKCAASHVENSLLPICLSSSSVYHEIPKDPVTVAAVDSHRNILMKGGAGSTQNRKQIKKKPQSSSSTATPASSSSQVMPMLVVGRLPSQTTSAQRREDTRP